MTDAPNSLEARARAELAPLLEAHALLIKLKEEAGRGGRNAGTLELEVEAAIARGLRRLISPLLAEPDGQGGRRGS